MSQVLLTLQTGANSRYLRNEKQHHEKNFPYFLYYSRKAETEIRLRLSLRQL